MIRRGPLTHATRNDVVEAFARVICEGAGNNPDQVDCGRSLQEGRAHLDWESFKPQAEAVLRFMGFPELT